MSATPETPAQAPARRSRRLLKRFGVMSAVLLPTLVALELVARLLPAPTINTDMRSDPLIGFRMPADLDMQARDEEGRYPFRLNSAGFRGPELPADGEPRPAERVLLVGDSFLNAWSVREERWVGTVLARELDARGRENAVHALSCKDIGTAQELLLLRAYGPRVQPTTIVLFLYPGNDLLNNTPALAGRSTVSPGDYFRPYLVPRPAGDFETRYALPAVAAWRQLRLFAWGESMWLRGKERNELMSRLTGRPHLTTNLRLRRKLLIEEQYELFRPPAEDSPWREAWSITETLIRAHRDEARRFGARFFVVVIPHLQQVERGNFTYANDATLTQAGLPRMHESLDWNLPETRLEAFLHGEKMAHVVLLGELRREMRTRRAAFYVPDGHLGGAGHEWMAALLARAMEDGGDTCFRAEDDLLAPIDVSELYSAPFTADFTSDRHPMLVTHGWKSWLYSEPGQPGGWQLAGLGTLLVPRSTEVVLRGKLVNECPLPATLRIKDTQGDYRVLVERTYDTRGAFELSFRSELGPATESWWPIGLEVVTSQPAGAEARVLLTELEAR
jgi:hypothetical protein